MPGIIELPGSFIGNYSSPIPQRGPLPSNRISFAIFIKLPAIVFKVPWNWTNSSCEAKASKKFKAGLKGCPVSYATSSANFSANPFLVLRPVPTAVPP